MQMGSSPRPGRQSPTPEPPGVSRAHFDRPSGQTLATPGEPGVAPEVPDRGDDLTPVPAARPSPQPRTPSLNGHLPLTAVSQTDRTAPDQGGRSGHRADPDLRIRILPHWLDRLH
jgi:hypothetical protein